MSENNENEDSWDEDESIPSQNKLRRLYSDKEDKIIVQQLKKQPDLSVFACLKHCVDKKILDRSIPSLLEHVKQSIIPRMKDGDIPCTEIPSSINRLTYTPKNDAFPKKGSREVITKKDIHEVVRMLINVEDKIAPTSNAFWKKTLEKLDQKTKHPGRCVSIFRKYICGKVETLDLSDDEKSTLSIKLGYSASNVEDASKTVESLGMDLRSKKSGVLSSAVCDIEPGEISTESHQSPENVQTLVGIDADNRTVLKETPCVLTPGVDFKDIGNPSQSEKALESTNDEDKIKKQNQAVLNVASSVFRQSQQGKDPSSLACALAVRQIIRLRQIANHVIQEDTS